MQIKFRFLLSLFYFFPIFSAENREINTAYKNKDLLSLISRACIEGNLGIISGFINNQHPASSFFLNARYDKKRNTLLHLALEQNQIEIAFYLIEQKAPLHLYNRDGWIPLHYAAEKNNSRLFYFLIQNGSPINAYSICGITPYGIAQKYEKTYILLLCKVLQQYTFETELLIPGAHKAYLVDEEGELDFVGWKYEKQLSNDYSTPQETIEARQSYFLQLQKTNSLPSFPSPLHLSTDDHPLSISMGK